MDAGKSGELVAATAAILSYYLPSTGKMGFFIEAIQSIQQKVIVVTPNQLAI